MKKLLIAAIICAFAQSANAVNCEGVNYIGNTCPKKVAKKKTGVIIGMTKEQVIKETTWGKPDVINRSVGKWGTHEQWVYRPDRGYLYFENGILTSYQN